MKTSKLPRLVAHALPLAAALLCFPAAAYEESGVTGGGTVKGKVTFSGPLPADAIEQIAITKNPDVCGEGNREVVWVDVKGGALRGVFVFIEGIEKGKKWTPPKEGKYVINQQGCRFRPWAQVFQPGTVVVRNSDKGVLHNINTRELMGVETGQIVKRTMFNFGQPDPGDIEQEMKPRRSPFVSINCEAHNFMFGFLMVSEHPYVTVVGEDGTFSIDDIPPGSYTAKAWHPRYGLKEAKLTVPQGGKADANFVFSN